jgi:hypothetical protein
MECSKSVAVVHPRRPSRARLSPNEALACRRRYVVVGHRYREWRSQPMRGCEVPPGLRRPAVETGRWNRPHVEAARPEAIARLPKFTRSYSSWAAPEDFTSKGPTQHPATGRPLSGRSTPPCVRLLGEMDRIPPHPLVAVAAWPPLPDLFDVVRC